MKTVRHQRAILGITLGLGMSLAWLSPLNAQQPAASPSRLDLANRPVRDIRLEGIKQVNRQLVLNQIRLAKGDPYQADPVEQDIVRITHLGRFASVTAKVEPQSDGTVIVTYILSELPILADVQTVGNRAISDQDLLRTALLRSGDPIDPFLIQRSIHQMRQAYQKEGYFQADIAVDQELMEESNILLFRIREGALARIRDIQFSGNQVFDDDQLRSKIKSSTYIWIFRKGEVNREQLESDAAKLREFYRDSGYLDAQVGRQVETSADQQDAVIRFVVSEGRQFTVDRMTVEGNRLFGAEQILQAMTLKNGDVFTSERLKKSQEALTNLYGKLGFIETKIEIERLYHEQAPKVDLLIRIDEGHAYEVGKVSASGNQSTQDKVLLRQVRGMQPGRRFDREGIKTTETRLKESSIFSGGANVTIQGDVQDLSRDVLVDVKEGQTGSISFGAGVSSDAGVIGAIELTQRNFDIADTPDTWGEFLTGRAFRGAGQSFTLSLQPGVEYSRYSINFREPYLLESDYFFDVGLFYFDRDRDQYHEERVGGNFGIGQRFGDVWSASIRPRAEQINVSQIDPTAPVDVYAVEGNSVITALGLSVIRDTTDSRLFPTKGSRTEFELSRAGVMGGDFDFTMAGVDFRKFWAVDEDFFGFKTVFSLRTQIGYIFEENEAPVFERLYAGGRSFRGFEYRGVGPRGIRMSDLQLGEDPIGGNWMFLLGLEYNFPIYEDIFRWVFFTDTGTVQKDIGLDEYRISIGTGIRLKIPFLGQAPFALDFAVPIKKQDGDQTQIFSFDIAVPFN